MTGWFTPSTEEERLLAQERLILTVTELVCAKLGERGLKRQDLANALGVHPAEVTQRLNGNRNLTLRSIADMFDVLGLELDIIARDKHNPAPAEMVSFTFAVPSGLLPPAPETSRVIERAAADWKLDLPETATAARGANRYVFAA